MARGQGRAAGSFRGPAGPRGLPAPTLGPLRAAAPGGAPDTAGRPGRGAGSGAAEEVCPERSPAPCPHGPRPARAGSRLRWRRVVAGRPESAEPGKLRARARPPGLRRFVVRRAAAAGLLAGLERPGRGRREGRPGRPSAPGAPSLHGLLPRDPAGRRAGWGPAASGSSARGAAVHRGRTVVRHGPCRRPPPQAAASCPRCSCGRPPRPPPTGSAANGDPGVARPALVPSPPSLPPGPRGSQPELQGHFRGRESGGRCITRLSCALI